MKASLMHRGRDFDTLAEPPYQADELIADLGLETVLDAMAAEDGFVRRVCRRALLAGLTDLDAIRYRQDILRDCLRQPAVVRQVYALAVAAIDAEHMIYRYLLQNRPEAVLDRAVEVMGMFVGMLRRLRELAQQHGASFSSAGFVDLFRMLVDELGEEYLQTVQDHLRQLDPRVGVLVSAKLGAGNRGTGYVLRKRHPKRGLKQRLGLDAPPSFTFRVPEQDETGTKALDRLRDQGLNLVANALAQSNDHVLSFFTMLRTELAFYVGCLNLADRLAGTATCFPEPLPAGDRTLCGQGLADPSLCLTLDTGAVVGNDIDAERAPLVVLTGANQGGKSTLLRAIGCAQLMMQCGMFVTAQSLRATVCGAVYSHFRREEDVTMRHGKLAEELARISAIVDRLRPADLVLFNESFAATNEREGSEIARQVVRALVDSGVHVVLVTHLYDLAHTLYEQPPPGAVFLRAQRTDDGRRTFTLRPGQPLPTSFGQDLYEQIFTTDAG